MNQKATKKRSNDNAIKELRKKDGNYSAVCGFRFFFFYIFIPQVLNKKRFSKKCTSSKFYCCHASMSLK